MKRLTLTIFMAAFLILGALISSAAAQQRPRGSQMGWYCPAPRYQIFQAPNPYGGMLMLDTQTGQSWQRVIVNTPKGVAIRWIKLHRREPGPGETILWGQAPLQ